MYIHTKNAHINEVHITQVYVAAKNLSRYARYVVPSQTPNQDVIYRIDARQLMLNYSSLPLQKAHNNDARQIYVRS